LPANELMGVVTVVTGQPIEQDALAFEPVVIFYLGFVASRTVGFLLFRLGEYIRGGMDLMAGGTVHSTGIVQAAAPFHGPEFSHGLFVTAEAGSELILHRITTTTESRQRRESAAAPGSRNVQAPRTMTGFAALSGKWGMGIIDGAMRRVPDDRHVLSGVAPETPIHAIIRKAGLGGSIS